MKFSQFLLTILVSAATALVASAYVGTGQDAQTTPGPTESAYDRVVRTGVLRCGYGISPPRLIKDPNTGALSGLDYDIWQTIGQNLNLKIEWTEEAGWGNFIEGLRTGRYDAFCAAMFPDESRSKFLSLSLPFSYDVVQTYVRADDHRFDEDIEHINAPDVTLPAIDGDVSAFAFKKRFPQAKLLSLPQTATVSDMFLSVTTQKADAIFLDAAMFESLNQSNPGQLRRIENAPPVFTFPLYYGFSVKEQALRDSVNVALRGMIDDGSLDQLSQNYPAAYATARKNF